MRCKKHFSDHSSAVGVCASCLRDRLFSLLESQSQSQSQTHPDSNPSPNPTANPNSNSNPNSDQNNINPPPLISRRKSEPIPRFFTTPQHNPKPNLPTSVKKHKFGLISKLFRSRSGKPDPNSNTDPTTSTTTSSSSSSFIYLSNKGLSPERSPRWDETQLSEPSPARGVPRRPSPGRLKPSPSRAGIAFCLSPLVRASPSRLWAESGYSGEIRVQEKPHLSSSASFCKNRSRKIADFGRVNLKR